MKEFNTLFIKNGNSVIGINLQGGYVSSWTMHSANTGVDRDVLYVGSSIKRTGIPILFPNFGKSEKLFMHGFGRDTLWKVRDHSDSRIVMEMDNTYITEQQRDKYSYSFRAEIYLEITQENSLVYGLKIYNTGDSSLPISPGLHPYWNLSHRFKKDVTIEGIDEFDAQSIDWDNNPPDTVYEYSKPVIARFPDMTLTIEDISPLSQKLQNIVVWTQSVTSEDYNYLCIEPVCGDHYSFDSNPSYVAPQERWEMTVRFSVSLV